MGLRMKNKGAEKHYAVKFTGVGTNKGLSQKKSFYWRITIS